MENTANTTQLIIGYFGIFGLIIIVITLSWKILKGKKKRENLSYEEMQENHQNAVVMTNFSPLHLSPQSIPLSSDSTDVKDAALLGPSTIKGHDHLIGDSPANGRDFPHKELLSFKRTLNDTGSSLSTFDTNLSNQIQMKAKKVAKESYFNADQADQHPNKESLESPAIEFKLVYDSHNCMLKVHVNRVSNLPVQFRNKCASVVKVSLYAHNRERLSTRYTNVLKKSLNPIFNQELTFTSQSHTFEEMKTLAVRLAVYAKRKQLSKKQLVGDLMVPLSRPDFEADSILICNEKVSLACLRTGKRGPLLMVGELGFLFVQLQYQPHAQRLKVLIRKGQNISNKSSNFLLTQPELYVIISLMDGNKVVSFKETKPSLGTSPVWNQPFLFDVPYIDNKIIIESQSQQFEHHLDSEPHQYWLQLLVMKGKIYNKDGVIGQVLISEDIDHWKEIMKPKYLEVAKWHEITRIGTHCF